MPSSSGTWDFALTNAEIVTSAYSLCGIRRPQLLAEHMVDARIQLNLLFSDWSNQQPDLWCVDLVSVPLVAGQATYSVDAKTVMILDAYVTTGSGASQQDRIILPISRSEYASYTDKNSQGFVSVFWFNRQINPTITLWLVPDSTQTYTLNYYRVTQIQDANLPAGEIPNIPYRWLNAVVRGLAFYLSEIYAPDKSSVREVQADKAFTKAATQDVENVELEIMPGIGAYFT